MPELKIKQALKASSVTPGPPARDEVHNNAQALKAWLEQQSKQK